MKHTYKNDYGLLIEYEVTDYERASVDISHPKIEPIHAEGAVCCHNPTTLTMSLEYIIIDALMKELFGYEPSQIPYVDVMDIETATIFKNDAGKVKLRDEFIQKVENKIYEISRW